MKNEQKHRTVRVSEFNPNNPAHWISHNEWLKITAKGAPRPADSSAFANDWAANNPTPAVHALGGFDFVKPMLASLTAISRGAQPVNNL